MGLGSKMKLVIWIDRSHESSIFNSFNVYGIPRTVGGCNRGTVGVDNFCYPSLSAVRTERWASRYWGRNERKYPICQQDNSCVKSQDGEGRICFFKNVRIVLYPVLVRRIKFPMNWQGWQSGYLTWASMFWTGSALGEMDHVYESLEGYYLSVCTWRRKAQAPHVSCFGQPADLWWGWGCASIQAVGALREGFYWTP